ncbi:MAG: ammonium transporter [Opitutaceae bacterium]|nr:ammonium transporter [Opitutaceae bacterium]
MKSRSAKTLRTILAAAAGVSLFSLPAWAEEAAPLTVDSGNNAWLMTSTALVLFMTLPGLALFYGGLVRSKNVLSVLAQCLGIAGLVTLLWWGVGYSLAFGSSFGSGLVGGTEFMTLKGVAGVPNPTYSATIPHATFSMFQLMFAIITPALIVGAVAERMKFSAVMLFVGLWMLIVYFPMAHMVWGSNGFMNGWSADSTIKAIDFAGGTVVHMASGWSALVLCLMIGPRVGFGKEKLAPHSMVLCMVGTGMLWVGWYGFNAGSALAADGLASLAFMNTTLAAATAAFVWGMLEKMLRGHASILGFCSGVVGGLVVITPAAAFVSTSGAVIIGVFAAVVPYFAVTWLKAKLKYDDALDAFGVHGVGGTLGALLTGILASKEANPALTDMVDRGGLWLEQVKAMGVTIVVAVVGTLLIGLLVKAIVGLRPTSEVERQGLDISEHGEEGYML